MREASTPPASNRQTTAKLNMGGMWMMFATSSNIFAILGLRSLYFLLAAAKRYLCHLEKAVIVILVYIGLKMLLDVTGVIHMTPMFSLAVVCLLLAGGVLASVVWPEKKKA